MYLGCVEIRSDLIRPPRWEVASPGDDRLDAWYLAEERNECRLAFENDVAAALGDHWGVTDEVQGITIATFGVEE